MVREGDAQRFGRYELREKIGEGGFATVYRAWDPALGRVVAIKALLPHLAADPEIRRRFLAEARAVAPLRHPNIVTIHDVGETDQRPFFAMELIEGESLAQMIARDPAPPVPLVAEILAGLGAALDAIHAANLVHRDIKASNVMRDQSGRIVLMDFGIARALDRSQHTRSGLLLGTPEAMAPEQVRGEPVGPAADIYALGVLTFQLLAGRAPFEGDIWHVLHAHAYDEPPSLRSLRPGLPEHTYQVVEAALAKQPEQRPQRASIVTAALAGVDDLPPTLVYPPVPEPTVQGFTIQETPPRQPLPGERPSGNEAGAPPVSSVPPTVRASQHHPATPVPVHTDAGRPTEYLPASASPLLTTPAGEQDRARRTGIGQRLTVGVAAAVLILSFATLAGIGLVRRSHDPSLPPGTEAREQNGGAPTATVPSGAGLPVVSNLLVCDNVFTCRAGEFEVGESVAACFSLTPGGSSDPLFVVVTRRDQHARTAVDETVLARSAPLAQADASGCYTVPMLSAPLPSGEYTARVLHGSTEIGRSDFRAVTPLAVAVTPVAEAKASPEAKATPSGSAPPSAGASPSSPVTASTPPALTTQPVASPLPRTPTTQAATPVAPRTSTPASAATPAPVVTTPVPTAVRPQTPAPTAPPVPTAPPTPVPTPTPVPPSVPTFIRLDIGAIANHQLNWLVSRPANDVTLGGAPFTIRSGNNAVFGTSQRFLETYPTQGTVRADVPYVRKVYILITGGYVLPELRGKTVGDITLSWNDGSQQSFPVIAWQNIREGWCYVSDLNGSCRTSGSAANMQHMNVYNDTQTRGTAAAQGFLDMLVITVPVKAATLTSITIRDTSTTTAGSIDPSIHITAITIEALR